MAAPLTPFLADPAIREAMIRQAVEDARAARAVEGGYTVSNDRPAI